MCEFIWSIFCYVAILTVGTFINYILNIIVLQHRETVGPEMLGDLCIEHYCYYSMEKQLVLRCWVTCVLNIIVLQHGETVGPEMLGDLCIEHYCITA